MIHYRGVESIVLYVTIVIMNIVDRNVNANNVNISISGTSTYLCFLCHNFLRIYFLKKENYFQKFY